MKTYFKSGKGIKIPVDFDGDKINEGDILTFDWFDCDNPILDMRRKFGHMGGWSKERISKRIHVPVFEVKRNEKGVLFGEGIKELRGHHLGNKRLYLHDFRFEFTKIIKD